MEWANLIVPSVISIIGFAVTYLSMCKQFKDSIKQQLTEEQRKVYLDTYVDVEKIVTTNEIIFEQKNTLKEKKSALKKAEKEVASLEAKKAKADAKAAEEAKKTEAEAVLKKLLASGMSADEILEKLK